jgi:phosphatidylglycerophosphate synthase
MTEQHPFISKVPNIVSDIREKYGIFQACDLLITPPEKRTWPDMILTVGIAAGDKLDGWAAKRYGSQPDGAERDRRADKVFTLGAEAALTLRGEISTIHLILNLGRETMVNYMRQDAIVHNRPSIEVGSRGRQKTAGKMTMITLARSPFSINNDLVESMASIGTALSLISGAGYTQQYLRDKNEASRQEDRRFTSGRNSKLRSATASPNQRIAKCISEKLPGVTPHHLTALGGALVVGSNIAALKKPKWGAAIAIGPYTLGGLIDGLDGSLARYLKLSSTLGMILDVVSDKGQEIHTATTNSILASRNKNSVAASQYAVAAMTASLPALMRASAEARGHIVSEDASGSRVVRAIEGGVGLGLNRYSGINNVISALMSVGNTITAAQRADVALRGKASPHFRESNTDPKFKREAVIRRNVLLPVAVGGLAVGGWLLYKEHNRAKKAAALEIAEREIADELTCQPEKTAPDIMRP